MNRFIKKVFAFIVLPILVGVPVLLAFFLYVNNLSDNYQINPEISTIYVGDSHIQLAVNDSILPQSLNLATSSESFYFSYYKLKMLLKTSPAIDRVYLGMSYHSISSYYERSIRGDLASPVASKYFYLLPLKDQLSMLLWNRANQPVFMKSILKKGFRQINNRNRFVFLGGYSNLFGETKAVNSSMDKRVLFQFYTNEELNDFSELNITYLEKIISLCKSKGIQLTLLNAPLHQYYQSKIPKEYEEKLSEIIESSKLEYIDLSNLALKDDCFIPDGDHVSRKGAEITTIYLRDKAKENSDELW